MSVRRILVQANDFDVFALAWYLVVMASSAATVEASQMWECDMSITNLCGSST